MSDHDLSDYEQLRADADERDRLETLTYERRKRVCKRCGGEYDGAAWDAMNARIPKTSTFATPTGALCPWLCGTEYASREPVRLDDFREHRRDVADFDASENVFHPFHDYPGAA